MTSEYIPRALFLLVHARACERCEFCHLPQESQAAAFHIDHVWPKSRGGLTDADNLALVCVACSLRKAARIEAVDPRTRKRVPLFNPRTDIWAEHFRWTRSLYLRGRTPLGRATVAALALNDPQLHSVRTLLARFGLFSLT